jgi:hypothetical protein
VSGGTPAQQKQSRFLVEAAQANYPMPRDGYVDITPQGSLGYGIAGYCWANGVSVTADPGDDMYTTALAHELCHAALGPSHLEPHGTCTRLVTQAAQQAESLQ